EVECTKLTEAIDSFNYFGFSVVEAAAFDRGDRIGRMLTSYRDPIQSQVPDVGQRIFTVINRAPSLDDAAERIEGRLIPQYRPSSLERQRASFRSPTAVKLRLYDARECWWSTISLPHR